MAISDGPPERSTGRIFFYLTDFDQTAVDLAVCYLSLCFKEQSEDMPGAQCPTVLAHAGKSQGNIKHL